ncbi:MAG: hypothetical protein ABFS38_14760 [Bacteroidota bacterium]
MKRLFIIVLSGIFLQTITAQDLIVTQQDDSIKCAIRYLGPDNISFSFENPGGDVVTTEIPIEKVKTYQRRYYTKLNRANEKPPGGEYAHLAQDLIVTQQNDSIKCAIRYLGTDNISFSFKNPGGDVITTEIPMEKVKTHQRKYYVKREKPSGTLPGREHAQIVFTLNGGYSYRLAKVPNGLAPDQKEYLASLKHGYNLGADLVYYITNHHGIGLKYSTYRASGLLEDTYLPVGSGDVYHGDITDDITINFAGPFYSARLISPDGRYSLIQNLGVGYLGYYDIATYIQYITIKGRTAGMVYDLGFDYGITKQLKLGIQASIYAGVLTEYEISDGQTSQTVELTKENNEGLGRLDFSVRLSYRL